MAINKIFISFHFMHDLRETSQSTSPHVFTRELLETTVVRPLTWILEFVSSFDCFVT